jgi:K+-sensing histidine kinase KdpD
MEITRNQRHRMTAAGAQLLLGIGGLIFITFVCFRLGFGIGRTSLAYVVLIALVSLLGSFGTSFVLSISAAACLDYFFAPPVLRFGVDAENDILRITAFLTTALVVTGLTSKLQRAQNELRQNHAKSERAERIAHFGW